MHHDRFRLVSLDVSEGKAAQRGPFAVLVSLVLVDRYSRQRESSAREQGPRVGRHPRSSMHQIDACG